MRARKNVQLPCEPFGVRTDAGKDIRVLSINVGNLEKMGWEYGGK